MRQLCAVLALLAAGCVAPAMETPMPAPPPDVIRYEDCVEHIGRFPVPLAATVPYLPAGFEPVPDAGGQTATAILLTLECTRADVAGAILGDVLDLWALLRVTPPDAYLDAETDAYILSLGGLASVEHLARTLSAWGIGGVALAEREQDHPVRTPAAREGVATARADGVAIEMRTSVVGPASAADGSTRYRLFGVDPVTRAITGAMDLRWTDPVGMSGQARVQVAAADGPFRLFAEGASVGTGAQYWGDYTGTLTRVQLP